MSNNKWGPHTWNLFHWLVINIKDDYYEQERSNIIMNIYNIIGVLPCPTCRSHALEYVNRYKIKLRVTKSELVAYLFNFHNYVNISTQKPIEGRTILDQYACIKLDNTVSSWLKSFNDSNHINMNDFMLKKNIYNCKQNIKLYFINNKHKFNNTCNRDCVR